MRQELRTLNYKNKGLKISSTHNLLSMLSKKISFNLKAQNLDKNALLIALKTFNMLFLHYCTSFEIIY